jgi:hypothetical protein
MVERKKVSWNHDCDEEKQTTNSPFPPLSLFQTAKRKKIKNDTLGIDQETTINREENKTVVGCMVIVYLPFKYVIKNCGLLNLVK